MSIIFDGETTLPIMLYRNQSQIFQSPFVNMQFEVSNEKRMMKHQKSHNSQKEKKKKRY